ncbi:hypothetical protein Q5M86_13465, partial [Brachyspira innocens]
YTDTTIEEHPEETVDNSAELETSQETSTIEEQPEEAIDSPVEQETSEAVEDVSAKEETSGNAYSDLEMKEYSDEELLDSDNILEDE